MRKLIVISFLTLDGVMQAPGGKDEDTSGGFQHGGWQMAYEGDSTVIDEMNKAGGFLIGRKTYDLFSRYWPTEGKDIPFFGDLMNNLPKYVASKTLNKVDWNNSTLLKGDLKEAIIKVKNEPGKDIYIWGSSDLCQTLMRLNVIDEYVLMIHPVVLGSGKRLFKEGSSKQDLELVNSKTTKDGIVVITYKTKA